MMDGSGIADRFRDGLAPLVARSRGRLFRKQAALLIALVGSALIANSVIEAYHSYLENRAALIAVQREKVQSAAQTIEQFIREIEGQLGWTTHATFLAGQGAADQRHFDFLRLLRQAPAVTEAAYLDATGREQVKVSRLSMDLVGSKADRSGEESFKIAKETRRHVGPIYFRKESEPYLTLAIASGGSRAGVTVAEVNLKFIWDVVSRISIGRAGLAYVVDDRGLLIAHPDIGLVLRKTDFSRLRQVAAVLQPATGNAARPFPSIARDRAGTQVLTTHAAVEPLGWHVYLEQPLSEAYQPIYDSLWRTALMVISALGLATLAGLWLAQRMVVPIQALAAGAARIGAGDLDHRLAIHTGDEVETLAESFNDMGARLKESYEGLERKVDERTRELAQSLEYQTATSEVLGVISRSKFELQPVLQSVVETSARLCKADKAIVYRFENGAFVFAAGLGNVPAYTEIERSTPITPGPGTLVGRVAIRRQSVSLADALADEAYEKKDDARIGNVRSMLGVPLLREGKVIGVIALARSEVRPFSSREERLVTTFADQAVIAIENARLFEEVQARTKELQGSLEYQTATSEVLGVISKSPSQLGLVFDAIVRTAQRLCHSDRAQIFRLEGGKYHLKAANDGDSGFNQHLAENPIEPGKPGSVTGRAVLEGRTVHAHDTWTDPDYAHGDHMRAGRSRTLLSVPLLRDGAPIGAITLGRETVQPYSEKEIALVTTFADQAVIAIENARLFEEVQARTREVTEALEYQTAISEVLGVISRSPTDVQPVFEAILRSAVRLCEGGYGTAIRFDGELMHLAAGYNHTPDVRQAIQQLLPMRPDRRLMAGRAIQEQAVVQVEDALADPEYSQQVARAGAFRSMLAVPLMRQGRSVGAIVVNRGRPGPFQKAQIALLQAFADQAVIAIENARLFEEVQARTREVTESLKQQTATADVLKAISRSAFDLQKVLDTLIEAATRLCGADAGILRRRDGEAYPLAATCGLKPEWHALVAGHSDVPGRQSIVGRALLDRQTVQAPDVLEDPEFANTETQKLIGFRAILATPLLRDGESIGTIGFYKNAPGPFSQKQIELVETFADQAVIAIENARLFEEVQARTKEVTEALEQQTATSEILKVISSTPGQLEPVFDAILTNARELCAAEFGHLLLFDGESWCPAALHNLPTAYADFWNTAPVVAGPETLLGRIAGTGGPHQLADALAGPGYRARTPLAIATVELGGARTLFGVPLLKEGRVIGAIVLYRKEVRPFDDKQVALLSSFADQAVIAIENARLFEAEQTRTRELQESLEYQTATSDVLGVISRSPNELQPVLDVIVATAGRLCEAENAFMFRLRQEDGKYHMAAGHSDQSGLTAYIGSHPVPPGRSSVTGRVALERRPVHVTDTLADTELTYADSDIEAERTRTRLGIPLLQAGTVIGVIVVTRHAMRPFTDKQIALVTTFADQAVIAINNVGLFEEVQARTKELTESLEQQTATSDVLNVISRSPSELQPVLDTLIETVRRMCESDNATIVIRDGDVVVPRAHVGPARAPIGERQPINSRWVTGRAVLEGRAVHVPDLLTSDEFPDGKVMAMQYGHRATLASPLMREGAAIGAILLRRTEPRAFTSKQISLLETFSDQAVIAIENARLFEEVQARTKELQESLEYQTATSEVLGVISRSPSHLEPVFDAIVETAVRLCQAEFAFVWKLDGTEYRVAAVNRAAPEILAYLSSIQHTAGRGTLVGRVALERETVHIPDATTDPDYTLQDALRIGSLRTMLGVPLLRDGVPIGVIALHRTTVRPFTEKQIDLVTTFADQAVIAIENARLFEEVQARTKEVTEALEYQTATSEVLGVISRSPNDLQPVVDVIVNTANRLCEADNGFIYLLDGDKFRPAAFINNTPERIEWLRQNPMLLSHNLPSPRAARERRTIHIADVRADPDYAEAEITRTGAHRAVLAVPLIRNGSSIGTIALIRRTPTPFTKKQIDLVTTFADQAVIAINNVRLFEEVQARTRELTESLERQTATSEVLNVISRSTSEVQPVLDTIVNTSGRLCGADYAMVFRLRDGQYHLAAAHGADPDFVAFVQANPISPGHGTLTGRTALEKRTVYIQDALNDPTYQWREAAVKGNYRTTLGVPLLRSGEAIGVIALVSREVKAFTEKQVELVETFADQAVIAIENARLLEELRDRSADLARSVQELEALGEVGRAVGSTLDLDKVLDIVMSRARDLGRSEGCSIFRYKEGNRTFRLWQSSGFDPELEREVHGLRLDADKTMMGRAIAAHEAVQMTNIASGPENPLRDLALRAGFRSVLFLPLVRGARAFGVLVLQRKHAGEFDAATVSLLTTFASQSTLAIQNARLFREVEEKGEQLAVASRHKSQFLANMSHELRTPLNAVLGYTELIQDGVYGAMPPKVNAVLDRVQTNGRHLLGLINDVLDLSKIEAGQLQLGIGDYSMTQVVHTVVTATEPLAASKKLPIRLDLPHRLPTARGDERRISQVLLNLLGNAIKFTETGEIRIAADVRNDRFYVSVTDTGPGIATAEQERIFEEFHQIDSSNTKAKGGTGLGLAISRRIVELHGGRITVASSVGNGATFTVELPVRVEQQAGAP